MTRAITTRRLSRLENEVTQAVENSRAKWFRATTTMSRAEGQAVRAYAKRHDVSIGELLRRAVLAFVGADIPLLEIRDAPAR